MSLETIYYIGQTIAVVAILGSLIAIFFQMRQTNKISMFNAAKDISEQFNALNHMLASDASLRRTLLKDEPLTAEEEEQVYGYASMFCNVWLSSQMAYNTGQADPHWFAAAAADVQVQIERWPVFKSAAQEWLRRYPAVAEQPIFQALKD